MNCLENNEIFANVNIGINNQVEFKTFSDTAPIYRCLRRGLNVETKCTNEQCISRLANDYIWISPDSSTETRNLQGEIIYRMNEILCHTKCPACTRKVQMVVANLGFFKCSYSVSYCLRGDNEAPVGYDRFGEKSVERDNGFERFRPTAQTDWKHYSYMNVKVTLI